MQGNRFCRFKGSGCSHSNGKATSQRIKSNPQELPVTPQIVENNNFSNQKTAPEFSLILCRPEGKQGTIQGRVVDVAEIAELAVDGSEVNFGVDGKFEFHTLYQLVASALRLKPPTLLVSQHRCISHWNGR